MEDSVWKMNLREKAKVPIEEFRVKTEFRRGWLRGFVRLKHGLVAHWASTDPVHGVRLRESARRGAPVLERAIYNILRYGGAHDNVKRLRRELTVADMELVDWETVAQLVANPVIKTAPQRDIGPVPINGEHGPTCSEQKGIGGREGRTDLADETVRLAGARHR